MIIIASESEAAPRRVPAAFVPHMPITQIRPSTGETWRLTDPASATWLPGPVTSLLDLVDGAEPGSVAIVSADVATRTAVAEVVQARPRVPGLVGVPRAADIVGRLAAGDVTARSVLASIDWPVEQISALPERVGERRRRPRLVSVVHGVVDGDSRVQKMARTAAAAGFESIVVGVHGGPEGVGDTYFIGDALVVRAAIDQRLGNHFASLHWEDADDQPAAARMRALEESVLRRWRSPGLLGPDITAAAARRRQAASSDVPRPHLVPRLFDFDLSIGPLLQRLRPDIIHAHDADTILLVGAGVERLRAAGHRVAWLVDVHENTPGTVRRNPHEPVVLDSIERVVARRADAVITVNDGIADRALAQWGLSTRPIVVENSAEAAEAPGFPTVREVLGLEASTPLVVYSGIVPPRRGVQYMVEALTHLPEVHFAIVARQGPHARKLFEFAEGLGVAARFHRVEYVPANRIVHLLSSADVGVIPFEMAASHVGLPTKYFEMTSAGLPLVVCGAPDLQATVEETGQGLTCRERDPGDLARAVREILDDRERFRERITDDLRERCSWTRSSRTLADVYRALVEKSSWAGYGVGAGGAAGSSPGAAPATGLVIGSRNTGGQAARWAAAVRAEGRAATSLSYVARGDLPHPSTDVAVVRTDASVALRVDLQFEVFRGCSAVLLESCEPMATVHGRAGGAEQALAESAAFARRGIPVGLVFHGDDVRSPTRHRRRERWSPFAAAPPRPRPDLEQARLADVHAILTRFEGPVFVTTLDLLDDVPDGIWLPPVALSAGEPVDGRDVGARAVPVVIRIEDGRAEADAEVIEPVLRRLAAEGVIRYRVVRGLSAARLPEAIRSADIVVDRVLLNTVSTLAVEAMAAGRVVVSLLEGRVALRYPRGVAAVSADPQTLETVIRRLAADADERRALAASGAQYAREWHDGRRSAEALRTHLTG